MIVTYLSGPYVSVSHNALKTIVQTKIFPHGWLIGQEWFYQHEDPVLDPSACVWCLIAHECAGCSKHICNVGKGKISLFYLPIFKAPYIAAWHHLSVLGYFYSKNDYIGNDFILWIDCTVSELLSHFYHNITIFPEKYYLRTKEKVTNLFFKIFISWKQRTFCRAQCQTVISFSDHGISRLVVGPPYHWYISHHMKCAPIS